MQAKPIAFQEVPNQPLAVEMLLTDHQRRTLSPGEIHGDGPPMANRPRAHDTATDSIPGASRNQDFNSEVSGLQGRGGNAP